MDPKPGDVFELRQDAQLMRVLVVYVNPLRCRVIGTRELVGWVHRLGSVGIWELPGDAIRLGDAAQR